MSSKWKKGRELEEEGQLADASRLYVEGALAKMNETDFSPGNEMWDAISELVQATSCAVRAGNIQRAQGIRKILEGIVDHIIHHDIDDQCLEGLLHEWVGDVSLMVGSEEAKIHYQTAANLYDDVSHSEQRFWGWQDEFNYALWAFQDFLKEREVEPGTKELPDILFGERIHEKLDVSKCLLGTDP